MLFYALVFLVTIAISSWVIFSNNFREKEIKLIKYDEKGGIESETTGTIKYK